LFHDFVEFIASLNARTVRYLIVGGYAVAFHARPRATKDIDVLIDPTPSNARRARTAIVEFLGSDAPELTIEKLTSKRTVVVLGRSPVRIDILTSLEGLSFRAAWSRRAEGTFGSERAAYIGLDDLVHVKEIAGRAVDIEDVRILRKVAARRR
jgi:predicted nucleotidyltransferase